ncbi:hypothetical protein C0991_006934 [Blastosporella zonata]|nr:hypothetical protein C0991_006934 [Blastosporella zonata]
MSLWNQSQPPQQLVRALWDEFERWAHRQRKLLERCKADIHYAHEAEWKATPEWKRNPVEHQEKKDDLVRVAIEKHTDMLLTEWEQRAEGKGLGPDAWGTRTVVEDERIAKLFQSEDALDRLSAPVVQKVYSPPQSIPVYNPAPPMSSTARAVNLSTSTSSSYQVIDPSSFSADDDEGYDAEESYVATTDESGDECYVPYVAHSRATHAKFSSHNAKNGSPDSLSSSSSSSHEAIQSHPASSKLEMNSEPPKHPPDIDRKAKPRARGPVYVGPYFSSPEDSSDEDDFKMFKMQTRVDKIWEFHYAAAQADVELAMAIANDRMSKKPFDEEARVAEHEQQMLQLQTDKEKERKVLVDVERKKRQEEIRKRPSPGEHGRGGIQSVNTRPQPDLESGFTTNHPVHLDFEKRAFALGLPSSPDEDPAWGTPPSGAWPDVRAPAPSENFGTVRARGQSQASSATPSGWKTKHTPSPPTTSSAQVHAALSTSEPPSWYERSATSMHDNSFDRDAFSAQQSTPVPPIPAGWGEKSPATSLLKKVLDHPVDPKPTPGFTSASKKPVKNLKGYSFAHSSDHNTAESPTTPTAASNARFGGNAVPKDIQPRYAQAHHDDETSSTPRPQGFMKRSMGDYMSDVGGSTPKVGMSRLGEMGMASTMGSSSWMNEANMRARQGPAPPMHSQTDDDDDERWGNVTALAAKVMEQITPQEDAQWNTMRRPQGLGASHPQQAMRDEGAWGRSVHTASSRLPPTKTSPPGPEPSLWEQRNKSTAQSSAFTQRAPPVTSVSGPDGQGEDFWKKAKAQMEAERSQPDETPWERMQRLRAQGSLPGTDTTPTFEQPPARTTGLHSSKPSWSGQANFESPASDVGYQQYPAPVQPPNQFWAPNGGTNTSQTWNHNMQPPLKQSTTIPGGYAFDTPRGYDRFGQTNPGSMQGKSKLSSSYTRHTTIEDEPDDEAPGGRYAQRDPLPYNSGVLLDIAEPKPSHPPTAFADVIDFDDEDETGEYGDSLSSAVPTPSTAPTSPPMSDEEWMMSVAENGTKGDFGSYPADMGSSTTKAASGWGPPAKPTKNPWGAQKLDTAKLQSALQSVPTTTTPPKAAFATTPPAASAPAAPAPAPAPKPEVVPTPPTKAPVAPEKPEPAKAAVNQNQKGGKKGKGKGKK